jgi:gas vesicle protein
MRHRDFDDDDRYVVIEKDSGGVGTFLLGLAIGAGLALLFAPRSGLQTRQAIAGGARRARRAATDTVTGVADKVTETFENARERVESQIERTRDAIETKRDEVQRAVREGRAAAQQARDDLEKRLAETKAAYNAGVRVAKDVRAEKAESREPRAGTR